MALVLTQEQQMLKDAAVGFFAEKSPIISFRGLRDAGDEMGYAPSLWQEMTEMGFTSLMLSEDEGGTGFGVTGAGIVAEAMATTLAPSPFISSSVTAVSLLKKTKSDLLDGVASGEKIATLAVDETGHHDPAATTTKALQDGESWTLNGFKTFVPDGHVADHIIVLARTGDKPDDMGLFVVDKGASGLIVDRTAMADSRNWAKVTLENVTATALTVPNGGLKVLTPVLDVASIVLSAELLGLSEAAFAMTMEYLKERKQFGTTIGKFQALQHRAAHLFSELSVTRSAILKAMQMADVSEAGLSIFASVAKARACSTAELTTNEAIQMHGGIGMTDEYDVGFFIKRARAVQNLYGGYNYHLDRYATLGGY